ncbi:alpha/beta hydrolase [Clostridium sp. HBUAS56017]|uniref:alpha/beta hydrolase n=1 Tax=Clostridium sp. HBUAS56017 TaxID=2571128 RepID=UPI001FA9FFD6|nr:alpha/beta hydrolase [Clostridium sp. HBUAS56017]
MKRAQIKGIKSKRLRKLLFLITCILVVAVGGIIFWMSRSYDYKSIAAMALKSNDSIKVTDDNFIVFTPENKTPTKGFIFYPGAKVEAEAYSPLCKKIAEAGYKVVIVKMPLNFAIFSPDKADEVINLYSDIDEWAIGGHSLGGVMASKYASNQEKIKGIVLYASYPEGDELEGVDKKVLSIWGNNDGVADLNKVKGAKLPKDAEFVEIEGGNHAQFGDYGVQSGDSKATIGNEEQMDIAAKKTIEMLNRL